MLLHSLYKIIVQSDSESQLHVVAVFSLPWSYLKWYLTSYLIHSGTFIK